MIGRAVMLRCERSFRRSGPSTPRLSCSRTKKRSVLRVTQVLAPNFIRRVVAELIEATGGTSTQVVVDRALAKSIVFSADVTGGVNPHYRKLYDKRNSAFIGSGVVWDQSAVHAGLMSYVRTLFNRNRITHQAANWGKTTGSKSEGGTVLPFFTQHGMSGLNVAIPLLSMHAPFELISKADLFEGFRAYRAFLRD